MLVHHDLEYTKQSPLSNSIKKESLSQMVYYTRLSLHEEYICIIVSDGIG